MGRGRTMRTGRNRIVVKRLTSPIFQRRRVKRAQPDRIHPQVREVWHLGGNALEIAYPISVRIGKRAGIDLVHAGLAPPVSFGRIVLCEGQESAC